MKSALVNRWPDPQFVRAENTAGVDTVVTIPAAVDEVTVLDWIGWSYSAAGSGRLRIAINNLTIFDFDVVDAGPAFLSFDSSPLYGGANQEVVITLDGVSGAVGNLNVRYR